MYIYLLQKSQFRYFDPFPAWTVTLREITLQTKGGKGYPKEAKSLLDMVTLGMWETNLTI